MATEATNEYISSPIEIAGLAMLGIFGNLTPFILPIVLGGIVDDFRLTTQQASTIASVELAGLGLGAYLWSRVVNTTTWRPIVYAAIGISAIGSLLSASATGMWSLLIARMVAGTGSGVFLAAGNTGLSMSRQPDRTLGSIGVIALLTSAGLVYVFSQIRLAHGIAGVFYAMSTLCLVLIFAARAMPLRSPTGRVEHQPSGRNLSVLDALRRPLMALALFSTFCFFVAAINFWVYIERVAVGLGFSGGAISSGLSVSQFGGAGGALFVAVLGTLLGGRLIPIIFLVGTAAASAFIIAIGPSYTMFVAACAGLSFAWAGFYPYLMGTLISVEKSGQLVAYCLTTQTIGKSAGPALMAVILAGDNFPVVYWISVLLFVVSLVALFPAVLTTDRAIRVEGSPVQEPARIEGS